MVYNDSPVGIVITWGLSKKRIIAGWADVVDFCTNPAIGNDVQWSQDMTLGNAGQASISIVQIDGYTPDEVISTVYPVAIPRTFNLGNTVPINTSSNSVVNDGNAAPTVFIESTPLGQGASSISQANDGSGTWQILSANVLRKIFNFVRGNTGSGKAVLTIGDAGDPSILTVHGNCDTATTATTATSATSASSVPATGVTAGALAAGVTSPNYMPFSGGTFTNDVTFNQFATAKFDTTAIFDQAQSGSPAALLQLQSSDQSPNARWTINQNTDGSLVLTDNTDGHTFLHARTAGGVSFEGIGFMNGNGAGTFSHGFAQTPTWVGITMVVTNSTMTVGVDGIGSTTVHVNVGLAGAFWQGVVC